MKKVKIDTKEQTCADASGSFEGPAFGKVIQKKSITNIPNFKQQDIDEVTDASSSGAYDVPFLGSGPKGRKDPLAINGPKSIMQSRAVKDKSFPKWGGPGGVYVKVKEKCKKFPYCNQGDIHALEMFEIEGLKETINEVANLNGIPVNEVNKIIINEIKKIITENKDELRSKIDGRFHRLEGELEKQPLSNEGLLRSMKMIGNGEVTTQSFSETLKYSEVLSDNYELVVYGSISNPVMTRGYSYEIIVFRGKSFTTQYGGGFGSPGVIAKDRHREFARSTGQHVYFNESIISEVCKIVREYFSQDETK